MKAQIHDLSGKKTGEMDLPTLFGTRVRADIALKYYEADKYYSPHSPSPIAGRQSSASGTISHRRHEWKGHYGKGISRVPRKAMWRRGEQFYWVGAEVNSTRGGRAVHTPRIFYRPVKINDREKKIAMNSAFASTIHSNYVVKRYERLSNLKLNLPLVISLPDGFVKSKQLFQFLKTILGDSFVVALQRKDVRSGKGKLRGRTYKSNAGLLLIKSNNEKIKSTGVEIKSVSEVSIGDLYPLGRLTLYTEQALKELK